MNAAVLQEALRYMGVKGTADALTLALTLQGYAWVEERERFKSNYVILPITVEENAVLTANQRFESADLARHLKGCREAIFFAATLGLEIERDLALLQKENMALALAADACATAMIEARCDELCEQLAGEQAGRGKFITHRYSVGYGDWDLKDQSILLEMTDAQRRAGIYLSTGGVMVPQKSVTAVIGITDSVSVSGEMDSCGGACASCKLNGACAFRKEE